MPESHPTSTLLTMAVFPPQNDIISLFFFKYTVSPPPPPQRIILFHCFFFNILIFSTEPFQRVSHLSHQSAPGRVPLLPGVRLQEGHLRHVRQENPRHQELLPVFGIDMSGIHNTGSPVFFSNFLLSIPYEIARH